MPYTQLSPPYTLPPASTSTLGGVKVDGTVVTVNASDQLEIDKNELLKGTAQNSIQIGYSNAGATGNSAIQIGMGINNGSAAGTGSIAIGADGLASTDYDVAIGYGAQAVGYHVSGSLLDFSSVAIGRQAIASNGGIQIGQGTNNELGTVCFGFGNAGNFQILDKNHKVPAARLPAATTSALGAVQPDGTTITVTNGVITAADQLNGVKTSTNSGKFLKINVQGEVVAESLPLYDGGVS